MESSALRCTPDKTLEFNVTSGSQSCTSLVLENTSDSYIAFKIKTTAPKSYLVKPSTGVISPKCKQDVLISVSPMFEEPKETVADRFLVQSTTRMSDKAVTKEMWAELANDKGKLVERRLAVAFNWLGNPQSSTLNGPRKRKWPEIIFRIGTGDVSEGLHNIVGRAIPRDFNELKAKYEELVAFCVALEKQKKEIETELDRIRQKMAAGDGSITTGPGSRKYNAGLEYWQVGLLVFCILVTLKMTRLI